MYYIAICDDDLNFANYIEKIIIDRIGVEPTNVVFYKYLSGEEFINSFERNIPFDLLILDMQMKKLDGNETAKEFRKKYPNCVLAFCSGIYHPTVKSFEANAFRYLMKEYDSDRMANELSVILKEVDAQKRTPNIMLSHRNEVNFVSPCDILYASIRKHGCNVYLYERVTRTVKNIICNKALSDLFAELDDFRFSYIHNSYFINLGYVSRISHHEVELIDGTLLTISKSKEKMFKEALAKYLANRY